MPYNQVRENALLPNGRCRAIRRAMIRQRGISQFRFLFRSVALMVRHSGFNSGHGGSVHCRHLKDMPVLVSPAAFRSDSGLIAATFDDNANNRHLKSII